MFAGRLTEKLIPSRLVRETDPRTGETRERWEELAPIRAERMKLTARSVLRRRETVTEIDAAYYVRIQHPVSDGWRVLNSDGVKFDVVVEPNRDKMLKILKCTRAND